MNEEPTSIVEVAVTAIRNLPEAEREELARLVLRLTGAEDEPEAIDPEDEVAVLEGLAQAQRGEFASEAAVSEAFRRFGK